MEINEIKKEEVIKIVSKNLRIIRKEKKITQDNVSKITGIDRTLLSKIENGTCDVTILNLYKLSKLYEVSIDQFFEKTE